MSDFIIVIWSVMVISFTWTKTTTDEHNHENTYRVGYPAMYKIYCS